MVFHIKEIVENTVTLGYRITGYKDFGAVDEGSPCSEVIIPVIGREFQSYYDNTICADKDNLVICSPLIINSLWID